MEKERCTGSWSLRRASGRPLPSCLLERMPLCSNLLTPGYLLHDKYIYIYMYVYIYLSLSLSIYIISISLSISIYIYLSGLYLFTNSVHEQGSKDGM